MTQIFTWPCPHCKQKIEIELRKIGINMATVESVTKGDYMSKKEGMTPQRNTCTTCGWRRMVVTGIHICQAVPPDAVGMRPRVTLGMSACVYWKEAVPE